MNKCLKSLLIFSGYSLLCYNMSKLCVNCVYCNTLQKWSIMKEKKLKAHTRINKIHKSICAINRRIPHSNFIFVALEHLSKFRLILRKIGLYLILKFLCWVYWYQIFLVLIVYELTSKGQGIRSFYIINAFLPGLLPLYNFNINFVLTCNSHHKSKDIKSHIILEVFQ